MDVKHLEQHYSNNCGPTCIAMITGESEEKVTSRITLGEWGSFPYQLALDLKAAGYVVCFSYFNPSVVRISDEDSLEGEALIDRVYALHKPTCHEEQHCLDWMVHYVKYQKQNIVVQMMTPEKVKTVLDMGGVLIALMTSNYMYNTPHTGVNKHYTVVVGYDRNDLLVYDPACENPIWVDCYKFLMGVYATCSDGVIDSGSILSVYEL